MCAADRFSSYTFGEGRTGIGVAVEFTHPTDVTGDSIREFLRTNVRSINFPITGQVNVQHGGEGAYTRYDIKQHDYAGGGGPGCGGYIETLEIRDAPDGRWGIVINVELGEGSFFCEFETLEQVRVAWNKCWSRGEGMAEELSKQPGFKRKVVCGLLRPWFYAIGNELLIGDYAFPEGLQDDPVFRFGRQCLVYDREGPPIVKTCMGTRFLIKRRDSWHNASLDQYNRLVYWDDGTTWNESHGQRAPQPLQEGEEWITEAFRQFRRMLAGQSTEFTVQFLNGYKLVGKLQSANQSPCAEGDYLCAVRVKGEKKPRVGWIEDFRPTPETPDVVQYIIQRMARGGKEVEHVEIQERRVKKGGRKWFGAFFRREF